MKLTFKKIILLFLALYFLVTCYTGYVLIRRKIARSDADDQRIRKPPDDLDDDWNPWGEEFQKEGTNKHPPVFSPPKLYWSESKDQKSKLGQDAGPTNTHVVEIWGKAAIGLYLWEHIMAGNLEERLGGIWSFGTKQIGNIQFRFRTGPGVVPDRVPKDVKNLVLVLNGRETSKIDFAMMWLSSMPAFRQLQNLAVILLGNEQCSNDWIKKFMVDQGGLVKFVFLIYDSKDIDNRSFYQWPLGVATYRNFPLEGPSTLALQPSRPYVCNFLGTVYPNSSRVVLLNVLKDHNMQQICIIKPRTEWLPQETANTKRQYLQALSDSDLTLNPVGKNTECYRIYEAMSYGSVPVIEDVMTPGNCGDSAAIRHAAPLRILKELGAPVIFIKDWRDLPKLIAKEKLLSPEQRIQRRMNLVKWYQSFKYKVRDRFVRILQKRFFGMVR